MIKNLSGYILITDEKPENGETVLVVTNKGNIIEARFETFLGNDIWETSDDFEDGE
jgi:hypothetical protein